MRRITLLDKVDGIEVLRKIKNDPYRKIIPVVVLTTSREERDIIESYKLRVNAYIIKPSELDKFANAVIRNCFFLVNSESGSNLLVK